MSINWSKPFSKSNWDLSKAQTWKNIGSAIAPITSIVNTGKIGELWDIKHPFGKKEDSSGAANDLLSQIGPMENGVYSPYIQNGMNAYGSLSNQYDTMNKDPAAYLESVMKGYTPSSGFNFAKNQALQGAGNTAASMGRRGGTMDVQNEANIANTLMSGDMQNWLKNTMGAQNYAMQGQQGIYDTGYKAASGLGGDLSNIAGTQALNAYQGQQERNKANQDMWSNIAGMGGTVFGGLYGGPAGAAAGGMAGRTLGQGLSS